MKIGKIIKWSVLFIVLVVIVAVTVLVMRLDGIIRQQVEVQSTASTMLKTNLGGVHLSILGGTIKLDDLKIAPPEGFTSPTMFEMGGLKVGVSYSQLTANPIKIDEIIIDAPKLVIEHQGGKVNVYSAMQQMPKSESSSTMLLIIGKLQVNNTQVVIKPGLPMLQPEYNLTLPSITVNNIGNSDGNQNGAAIKDVLKSVWTAMLEKVKESDKVPGSVKPFLTSDTQDMKSAATQKAMEYLQENKDVKKAQDSLQNLLGGKKK